MTEDAEGKALLVSLVRGKGCPWALADWLLERADRPSGYGPTYATRTLTAMVYWCSARSGDGRRVLKMMIERGRTRLKFRCRVAAIHLDAPDAGLTIAAVIQDVIGATLCRS